jgi:hypothetical protein
MPHHADHRLPFARRLERVDALAQCALVRPVLLREQLVDDHHGFGAGIVLRREVAPLQYGNSHRPEIAGHGRGKLRMRTVDVGARPAVDVE